MRVALVTHYFPPHVGGVEIVVERQAVALADLGHDVHVVTTALPGPPGTVVDPRGFTVHRMRSANPFERAGVPFPLPGPRAWRQAWRAIGPVDVVHVHDVLYVTSWAAGARAALRRIPVVLHQHVAVVAHPNPVVELVQRAVYASMGRRLARRASTRFVLNERVMTMVDGLVGAVGSTTFLANGVDHGLFRPPHDVAERRAIRERFGLPESDVLAIFVGRPVPKKGFPMLLSATGPGYRIVTVGGPGTGPDPSGRVIHLGSRDREEVAALLRASDIFVLPSVAEGFPLSVQEAMASGLPIITTDDPGYARYALDRSLVRLIEPSVEPLRAALEELAGDEQLRRRMGAYSRSYAHGAFSWREHAREVSAAYARAVEGSR